MGCCAFVVHVCDQKFARSDDANDALTPNRDGVNGTIGPIGEAAHDLESAHRSIASNQQSACLFRFYFGFEQSGR
jgi:hypothetical protein